MRVFQIWSINFILDLEGINISLNTFFHNAKGKMKKMMHMFFSMQGKVLQRHIMHLQGLREIQDMNGVVMQNKNIRKIAKRYEGAYFVFCCFWATMDFMLIVASIDFTNILLIIMSIKISISDLAICSIEGI
ncbi:hypothetical protein ACJX0J_039152 [Zea mays]